MTLSIHVRIDHTVVIIVVYALVEKGVQTNFMESFEVWLYLSFRFTVNRC